MRDGAKTNKILYALVRFFSPDRSNEVQQGQEARGGGGFHCEDLEELDFNKRNAYVNRKMRTRRNTTTNRRVILKRRRKMREIWGGGDDV